MNSCTIVIFGFTGDLAKRKLLPALYNMLKEQKFSKLLLIGCAREQTTVSTIFSRAAEFLPDRDEELWKQLENSTVYTPLNFTHKADYDALEKLATREEKKRGLSGNRLLYLAAPPQFFCDITKYAGGSGLAQRAGDDGLCSGGFWHRLVYEKPFGFDQESAHAINACIKKWFVEQQIYRIDHYLTKELVGNIALVRFTNIVFEPLWNNMYVDNVQITLSETIGIEGRAGYYNQYGVIKDVIQNHVLQLLALIAMEGPSQLRGEYIRDEKAKVLAKTKIVDGILGQYDMYCAELNRTDTQTPTFALLKLLVDTPRWHGVPFFVRSGKKLAKKEISICVTFKKVACPLQKYDQCFANYVIINVAPDSGFSLELNAKKPGLSDEITPVRMHFCHSCLFGPVVAEAYEVLLDQVMAGDQSVSVRFDEIEQAWNIVDGVGDLKLPLYSYQSGSQGPEEVTNFLEKNNVEWKL